MALAQSAKVLDALTADDVDERNGIQLLQRTLLDPMR